MSQTAPFEEEAFEAEEDIFADVGSFGEEVDAFEELAELEEFEGGLDTFDELAEAEEAADEFEEALEEDRFEEGEELDTFGDYAYDEAAGLYLPRPATGLIAGPAAVAVARRLNPFVVEALDADDADAFFRRIRRGLQRVGRGIGRVARVAAPLLRRALPIVQRVAGMAGPWGRVISAGIGAARGLMEGRGLRGALAGALSGAIPGIGGRLAGAVLRGDGADDDAALDALADMADAGQVPPGVAMPLGAGLAARVATPRGPGCRTPAMQQGVRRAEGVMLRAARAAGGPAGRRLRILRAISRLARAGLRAQVGAPGAPAPRVLPSVAQSAARRVLGRLRASPSAGASSRASALRRLALRRRILSRLPATALFPPQVRAA